MQYDESKYWFSEVPVMYIVHILDFIQAILFDMSLCSQKKIVPAMTKS